MGYVNGLETVTEGIMCTLGYSNKTSGLCSALVFIGGLLGSFLFGFVAHKIGKAKMIYLIKVVAFLMGTILVGLMFVMKMTDQAVLFALTYFALGFCTIG